MYYETSGDGPTLLLLLGLALDVSEVETLALRLSRHFEVVVIDNRGAGRTESPKGPYSIPMMANDVIGLMNVLSLRDARVVGISMGAKIALELASQHPERVRDLVLISAGYKTREGRRMPLAMHLALLLRRTGLAQGSHPQSMEAFEAQRAASWAYGCADSLSTIAARTLVLHGRRERLAPLRDAEELTRELPSATLRTFPGGHLFFFRDSFRNVVDSVSAF